MANNKAGSSSGSDNSSLSNGSEEEQLRRLFNSCDADGDGFLDGEDLRFMCRMLNMSDSVDEVQAQLGLTEMSKISFQDFLHCRSRVMLQSGSFAPTTLHPDARGAGTIALPPPTVMMSGVGKSLSPSQTLQHYCPGGTGPVSISLPSSLYPYPHQPSTDPHTPGQCQPSCQHHHHHYHQQQNAVAPPHQRYHSTKLGVMAGGSGEDTGIESDVTDGHLLTSWPTLSSDSLGALSCTRPESADYDSGARDLSPEPGVPQPTTLTLSQLVERHDPETFTQLREAGADSLLGIADRLHAAALTSMKGEVEELQNQVRRLTLEYRPLTSSPSPCPGQGHSRHQCVFQVGACEPRLGPSDFEERLEQLTARYEERIIELHSVIAELRKKVERHQISVIREEDEFEESDQAQSTHSNDGGSLRDENIEISQEFSRVVSEIQPTMDRKPFQPADLGTGLMSESYQAETEQSNVEKPAGREDGEEKSTDPSSCSQPPEADGQKNDRDDKVPELPPRAARPASLTRSGSQTFTSDPAVRLEVATLRAHNDELLRQTSEVTALRAHNDDLSRRSSALEAELAQMSQQMGAELRKKEELAQQVTALQHRLDRMQSQHASADVMVSPARSPAKLTSTPPPTSSEVRSVEAESYPVAKMAELKKLKTCASDSQVLGSQVTMLGVQNTSTAEHLVQALHQVSGVAELLKTAPGSRGAGGSLEAGGDHQINAAVVAEFEVELERRQARSDHLKAQNDVLSATLEESRSYAERLSVLMGKYESNNTALQLASAFSDHCLEAQDVLTALLDTEMGVLLANCRAAGLGALGGQGHDCEDQHEVTATLHRAHHARRKAESVAAHLLARLDRTSGGMMGSSSHGMGGAGGGGWEDVSTTSRTASTSSTSSSTDAQHGEFNKVDEERLRDHIQQLKAERSAVRTTVLEIESVHMDPVVTEPRRRLEAQRLDLENAVLVQELMAVKEEKAELKAGSYLLEKETKALELRLVGHEAQESALRLQVDHLQGELQQVQQQPQQEDSIIPTTPRSPSKQSLSNSPSLGVMAKKSKISGSSPSSTLSSSSSSSDLAMTKSPTELARDLAVAKAREATLKSRVSELLSALEKISRNSELRHRQSSEFVGDLKRANAALISAFDRAKRKYQSRLKKMEGQLRMLREGGDGDSTGGGGVSRSSGAGSRGGGVVVMRQPPPPLLPPPDETSL